MADNSVEMGLLDHMDELRYRLLRIGAAVLICTIIASIFTNHILALLISPYGERLQVLGPTEGIVIYFRVALTAGLALAMPYIIYQMLMFILPGLEEGEKAYVRWGVPSATLLFLIGISFAWFILIPAAIGFLSSWQTDVFSPEWRSKEYIPFVTSLVFWIGVSFETPLIFYILGKLNLITPKFMIQQWRFALIIIAIVSALITPTADPFNMGLVMLPLIMLYGLSIFLVQIAQNPLKRVWPFRRKKDE